MSTHTAGWVRCLDVLRHAPEDSFEHRLGDQLAAATDDEALTTLIEIVTEDPCGTPESEVACHMLRHLAESEATS
ncbi:hypothetical protein [Nocardia wallacei]|uniref:hypothetical protein n=1 Tax=Nocardia wallacei TaxID=480035 RepID=UPI00245691F4|nr:hypothetical protein [Nocardia wallacei]